MTQPGALVRACGIDKVIDDIPLCEPVDLLAEPGQCVVVRGPNGSGKTTVLTLVAGLWAPSTGTVTIDGAPSDDRDPQLRARVSVLIGAPAFYRDMTLADHLTLVDATWGRDATSCEDRVYAALAELGLQQLASRFPHELSSGQTQLFRLTLTLFRPGDLLILDEPEQRLDTSWRSRLSELLRQRTSSGTTVIMACHDPEVTEAVADRVIDLASA